jgi:hypothetical protein
MEMGAKRGKGRVSLGDYTPHEHEELRTIAKHARQRLQLVTPPNRADSRRPRTTA